MADPTEDQIAIAKSLWADGVAIRIIGQQSGIDYRGVKKLCQKIKRRDCACGRPAGHRGHCTHRIKGDPERFQRFSVKYRDYRPTWSDEAVAILKRDYPRDVPTELIISRLKPIVKKTLKPKNVINKALKIGLARSEKYLAHLLAVARSKTVKMQRKNGLQIKPFAMSVMSGPDPMAGIRLRQIREASRGKL